ncbi:hypothetical protein ABW20_dc0101616 [Dactylellina cionopaga]|nr:hypothetical protein ABW20_dc0101616 [Dactylellina cionopaga]
MTSNLLNANLPSDEEDDEDFEGEEEEVRPEKRQKRDANDEEEDDDEDEDDAPKSSSKRDRSQPKPSAANEDDEIEDLEDDDDDEDEDDDEDDEEDDEEDEGPRRRGHKRRVAHNPFIDNMAEVDEEDEDGEEDDDEMEIGDFLAPREEEESLRGNATDDRYHRELDRRNQVNLAQDAETIAASYRDRYGRQQKHRLGDASTVTPKRLLLPSVNDPSIWGVKCKPGKEKEAVFFVMKKMQDMKGTKNALSIISVLERGQSMQGFLYVEARRQADVLTALTNVPNVYARSGMILVPVDEMPDLLRVQKRAEITPGTFVRFKRGKYQGDLAQVENVENSGQILRVRAVPRIDYSSKDDAGTTVDASGKRKRLMSAIKPPQRLFSEAEAKKYHAKDLSPPQYVGTHTIYTYQAETYEDGYLVKDVRITALQTENVNPKLEEVTRFANAGDGNESLDLQALSQSLKASTDKYAPYQPGDMVEVYAGEQAGMIGKVTRVRADIVSMKVEEGKLKGKDIDVPFKGLRKKFKAGDHVKVMGGSRYRDEVGLVVKIVDDRVTFLSDLSMEEITVFSRDLREASDSGGMGAATGKYDLWDLVQLKYDPKHSKIVGGSTDDHFTVLQLLLV